MARPSYPSDNVDKLLLRFPEGMRDRIKEAAEKSGRSMNAEVVTRLEFALEHDIWEREKFIRLLDKKQAVLDSAFMHLAKQLQATNSYKNLFAYEKALRLKQAGLLETLCAAIDAASPDLPPSLVELSSKIQASNIDIELAPVEVDHNQIARNLGDVDDA